MATVTQLQNSHSKGPGGSCEGKGPKNEFRWQISLCSLPALPCPSLRSWLLPLSCGYQLARGCERDARRGGVATSCLILSFLRAIRRATSPVPLHCCPVGGMQLPAVFCTHFIFPSVFLLLKHMLCRRRWLSLLQSLQSKRSPAVPRRELTSPLRLVHHPGPIPAPAPGSAELPVSGPATALRSPLISLGELVAEKVVA